MHEEDDPRSDAEHDALYNPELHDSEPDYYETEYLGPVNTYLSASKMSTKWMKPMNITSSFSNRENIRR